MIYIFSISLKLGMISTSEPNTHTSPPPPPPPNHTHHRNGKQRTETRCLTENFYMTVKNLLKHGCNHIWVVLMWGFVTIKKILLHHKDGSTRYNILVRLFFLFLFFIFHFNFYILQNIIGSNKHLFMGGFTLVGPLNWRTQCRGQEQTTFEILKNFDLKIFF